MACGCESLLEFQSCLPACLQKLYPSTDQPCGWMVMQEPRRHGLTVSKADRLVRHCAKLLTMNPLEILVRECI